MFQHFVWWDLPPLFVTSALTFGGLIPLWNAPLAMRDFGLPERVVTSRPAQSVMVISSARTSVIGATLFMLYSSRQYSLMDSLLAMTGFYLGAVDGYICWKENVRDKAVFRLVSGIVIGLWGLVGVTRNVHES